MVVAECHSAIKQYKVPSGLRLAALTFIKRPSKQAPETRAIG